MSTIDDIKKKYCMDDDFDKKAISELKKKAPALLERLNSRFKRNGWEAAYKFRDNSVYFSDGYYMRLVGNGKWNDKSRAYLRWLDGLEKDGVIFKNQSFPAIYLKKSWRPESHRGQIHISQIH